METAATKRNVMVNFFYIAAGGLLLGTAIAGAAYVRSLAAPSDMAGEAPPGTATLAAKPPIHYYAMQTGDEYGYEPSVSDDQKQAGQIAAPLVMIRYAGEKKGQYQVFQLSGKLRTVFDCEKPCNFVRVRTAVDGEEIASTRIRRVEGSIAYYAMEDAMNGQLTQHFIMKKGQRLTFWYAD